MKFGLREEVIEKIQQVLAKYPQINQAILYGSRAKGTYKNGSDIDITLKGAELNLRLLSQISHELDDLLIPYKIDLSIFHEIENADLLEHIGRVGVEFV